MRIGNDFNNTGNKMRVTQAAKRKTEGRRAFGLTTETPAASELVKSPNKKACWPPTQAMVGAVRGADGFPTKGSPATQSTGVKVSSTPAHSVSALRHLKFQLV